MVSHDSPVVHDDPGIPPPPLACACGEAHPWVWYTPRKRDLPASMLRPRWAAPKVDPCPACNTPASAALEAEAELQERMRRSGVPRKLVPYRLDRMVRQPRPDEVFVGDWMRQLRGQRGAIGIVEVNEAAWEAVLRWSPGSGWLALWGGVGRGKSLMLAAVARRMLTLPPRGLVALPTSVMGDRPQAALDYAAARGLLEAYTGTGQVGVLYLTVDELARREQLRWKGDPGPAYEAATCGCLLLDELGASPRPSRAELDAVERVVAYRYDHGLPLALSTNLEWPELTGEQGLYGRRVADRLAERVGVGDLFVGGPSWRQPPAAPEEEPPAEPRRRRDEDPPPPQQGLWR